MTGGVPDTVPRPVVRRAARALSLPAVVLLALAGAATSPAWLTLLWGPAVAGTAIGVTAILHPHFPGTASARRATVYAGTGAMLLVPAVAGLELLGPRGAAVGLALLSAAGMWAVSAFPESEPDASAAAIRRAAAVRRSLPDLALDCLLEEWRRSGLVLEFRLSPRAFSTVAELRSLLVDELTRRDPAGVEQWLREGGDPEEYLTGGTGRPA